MKILHVADLHLQHEWFDWVASHCVSYDLVVMAGDLQNAFSNTSMHDQARAVSKWLLALKAPTVVCSGNHDFWVRDPRVTVDVHSEAGWLKSLRGRGNIVAVDGDTLNFSGLRILVNGWLQVPEVDSSIDIVVTHAPPSGCACACSAEGQDVGDPDLWPALQNDPPWLVLSGHIHAPRKHVCTWPPIDPTSLVLVPGVRDDAVPTHWIIDTETNSATHSSGESVKGA